MKIYPLLAAGVAFSLALPALTHGARAVSDLLPPAKRQAMVETAESLAKPTPPPPLAADLPSPFNPPEFEKPDPADAKAGGSAGSAPQQPAQPVGPVTDREILEALAAQINPTGMMQLRGASQLIIGGKRFEVGTRFTVTFNDKDYELVLVRIDRTTFTLRYRNEEITRPIKPVR